MKILKERTRLIFSEYTDQERKQLEDLVGTSDKVLFYEDPDTKNIAFPPGMINIVKQTFPKADIIDKSNEYWSYANITPVEHNAQPRNQLQIDYIKFLLDAAGRKENTAGVLSPGTGKGLPLNTKIPCPAGHILMGDIKVGDVIFGSDGKPTKVLGVYDQGKRDIYKITFSDGRESICDDQHLWMTKTYMDGKYTPRKTIDMVNDFKIYDKSKLKDCKNRDPYRYKYRIPVMSGGAEFNEQYIPIHPYVLGAFIGNGCLTDNPLTISSGNEFVPDKIAKICNFTYKKNPRNYSYNFYTKNGERVKTSDFFKDLPEMIGKLSSNKYIPNIYIYNSIDVRMELIRGLMDTDGSISYADGIFGVSYSSCSRVLLDQIQFIMKSLGFNAHIHDDKRTSKYRNGYHGNMIFLVPNSWKKKMFSIPYKLDIAKQASLFPDTNRHADSLIIKNIEHVGQDYTRCIRVDSDDHLFLTEDFIVTHNTFMSCYSAIKVGYRTLIIAPTNSIKQQWVDTLTDMFKVPAERVLSVNSPIDFVNIEADFVIVSQATLASLNKNYKLEELMKNAKFGIKIIDEVQMWFHNIVKIDANSNICLNWYITGTFGRSGEVENDIYQKMFGHLKVFREKMKTPTILNRKPGNIYGIKPHMHINMVWGKSGLTHEEISGVSDNMRYAEREGKWIRYGISIPKYTKLIIPEDGHMTKFLSIILKTISKADKSVNYGRMLILVPTIKSISIIHTHITKMFPGKTIGEVHSKQAKELSDKAKASADIVISTTQSAGTGFDMKDLSKLVVCTPFQSWILADQVSGRLRQRPDGKDTYMWDVVDASVPQLRKWANGRAEVYKRKSKVFKVVDP